MALRPERGRENGSARVARVVLSVSHNTSGFFGMTPKKARETRAVSGEKARSLLAAAPHAAS